MIPGYCVFTAALSYVISPDIPACKPDAWSLEIRGQPLVSTLYVTDAGWANAARPGVYMHNNAAYSSVILLGATNYRYFAGSPRNILNAANTFLFSIPGTAQADIGSSNAYRNGRLLATVSTMSTVPQDAKGAFRVGNIYNSKKKAVQFVRLFNRQLTDDEVSYLYRVPEAWKKFRDDGSLVLYWNMRPTQGIVKDLSGHGYHGTVVKEAEYQMPVPEEGDWS